MLLHYAGNVWWDWPSWVTYGLMGIALFGSPITWAKEERKRARKMAEAA